jgi:hypothetical protein
MVLDVLEELATQVLRVVGDPGLLREGRELAQEPERTDLLAGRRVHVDPEVRDGVTG